MKRTCSAGLVLRLNARKGLLYVFLNQTIKFSSKTDFVGVLSTIDRFYCAPDDFLGVLVGRRILLLLLLFSDNWLCQNMW